MDVTRLKEAARTAAARLRGAAPATARGRALAALLAALLLAAFAWVVRSGRGADDAVEVPVFRGTLRITVSASGVLAPVGAQSYGAEVPGVEMKILELAPEGSTAAAGTVLVRFDDGPFRRELEAAESRAVQMAGEEEQARQAHRALVAGQRSDRSEAEAALRRAELDLTTFVNGTAPMAVRESAAAVERREREAEDAARKVRDIAPFVEKGFISRDEFRTAERRADQAEADLVLARQQHETLVGYTHPQLLAQKQEEVRARREAVGRSGEKGAAQVAQAHAALALAEARTAEARRSAEEARRRLSLCTVAARSPGTVVYRTLFEKNGERRRVRAGDSVFAGQPVVDLPDMSRFLVEARVREGEVHRLSPGLPADVLLDAFPGRTFAAKVERVGTLSGGDGENARSFPVVLALDSSDPRMRPGMSAQATIRAGEAVDVLLLPVDAVRREGKDATCLVRTALGVSSRRVVTGRSNAFHVEIRSGLSEGDVVLVGGR